MSRINTNVAALTAQRGLAGSQKTLSSTLQRLSSGLRINTGADDPAGLIASEGLRSEISGLNQAVSNSQRAGNVISTTDGALGEVSALLQEVKALIVQSANEGALSPDEIKANQLQIDSAVASITRISSTTTFAGLRLLDGGLDYITSGVANSAISSLHISQANFGTNSTIPVQIKVITSARQGDLQFRTATLTSSTTLQIAGNRGTEVLSFTSGTTASAIAYAVNGVSDSTGVSAKLINPLNAASGVEFLSNGFGSRQFVSLQAQTGTFGTVDTAGAPVTRVTGRDAVATVNGAVTTADGLNLKVNTAALSMDVTLDKNLSTTPTDFTVTGGGAMFQLGAQVTSAQQVSLGVQSVAASSLGNSAVGYVSDMVSGGKSSIVDGHAAAASDVIEAAINQVSVLRGRLGAFQKDTLDTNIASLTVAVENVTSSESNIRDADFAAETSNLTRAQILTQAGTSVLSTANSSAQNVLSLLQGH